ncbi:ROK family protein [Izhakiella australiensis]|uniref:ROK family protein n=1 Tax=Izhakiella australiensis TaxID=1926881 RepID=A0A1S8YC96_9GAMM|nr:ROK family transcriptional regulator [Izhakiella australiensis]OON36446.1 ROK family protein [Izhakiella australiensis]
MFKESGKGPALLRLHNEKRLLAALRQVRETTRQDLAEALALSKNTVSLIVDELIARGWVSERGALAGRSAGRPKIRIALEAQVLKSAGIMVERHQLRWMVCDYFSRPLAQGQETLETGSPQPVLERLAQLASQLASDHPGLLGIGFGFPGIVDPRGGILHLSSHLGWRNVDLLSSLNLSVPVAAMNIVKAAALLSLQHDRLPADRSRFYLRVGEGVGGALVNGSDIYTGNSWTAGEAGHLMVEYDGPACRCGQRGCLEAVISVPAIEQRLASLAPGLSWHTRERDPQQVDEVMHQAGTWLGRALSQIMLLLNPAVIVVDAPWNKSAAFSDAACEAAKAQTLSFTWQNTQLLFMQQTFDPAQGLALAMIEQSEQSVL